MSTDHTTAWLLGRWQSGDASARGALIARLTPMLTRWVHGRIPARLRDAQDTGDLVQTALLRVLAHLDHFQSEHPGALYGYLRTASLNALRDALRGAPVDERVEIEVLESLPALPDSPLEAALGRDGAIAYEKILWALEPALRSIVMMRFEFGMSFPEIAAELGETPDAVRMRVNRALRRMAAELGRS